MVACLVREMIFDKLSNAIQYFNLDPKIQRGLEFLMSTDLANLADVRYLIDGKEIYANVQSVMTKPITEQKWEAHRKYIDIQYIIEGVERMGFGTLDDFKQVVVPYDSEEDVIFLEGRPYNYVNLTRGDFVIFFPYDVHAPLLQPDTYNGHQQRKSNWVRKVVVKIPV